MDWCGIEVGATCAREWIMALGSLGTALTVFIFGVQLVLQRRDFQGKQQRRSLKMLTAYRSVGQPIAESLKRVQSQFVWASSEEDADNGGFCPSREKSVVYAELDAAVQTMKRGLDLIERADSAELLLKFLNLTQLAEQLCARSRKVNYYCGEDVFNEEDDSESRWRDDEDFSDEERNAIRALIDSAQDFDKTFQTRMINEAPEIANAKNKFFVEWVPEKYVI